LKYRPLEDLAGVLREQKRIPYASLMAWRVRSILLVSSLYDSFTFQEDGHLTEMLFAEYIDLNLRFVPVIRRVSTAEEAIERVAAEQFDLVITMPRVGEMDVFAFGAAVKLSHPTLPVVLLAYDTRELALLREREAQVPTGEARIDRMFVWQGDARIFLAIIKWAEDRVNAAHDALTAGVKSIILVEDSVRFYSAYLPLLYTEIVKQTQALMAEGVNRMQRLMRMRARAKILLASTFEEGEAIFREHSDHVLGVIVDARFPKDGVTAGEAGIEFIRMVKAADPEIPVLMQSSEPDNAEVAAALGAAFIDKSSPTLLAEVRDFLTDSLGFGDFVFRNPDGGIITTAKDLRSLVGRLRTVPEASLLYHASRNDFSTWLMARTEFDLAKTLRPVRCEEFGSAEDLRQFLLGQLSHHREVARAGLVAEFSSDSFDTEQGFTRIGSGSLGGKGRGLAFFHSLANSYDIEQHLPGTRIFIPPSAVLATDIFDRFMEESRLLAGALGETSDEEVRRAFLSARLPKAASDALRIFLAQVDYPLAVRSSSLLEDASHQPFAGIYDTFMLPNNHPDLEVRLAELSRAIRLVYGSTYYADSKSYIESTPNRLEEEKMAVVIQQIVGRRHGDYLYPDIAGVARSFDYYPMPDMHAEDGVASVALGLGRTVVNGGRCVRFSPHQPRRLYQFANVHDYIENSQPSFFALDLAYSQALATVTEGEHEPYRDAHLVQLDLETALRHGTLDAVGSVYSPDNDRVYEGVHRAGTKLVTMAGVLSGSHFDLPRALVFLLEVGKSGLSCHVEIEFALNLRRPTEGPHELGFLQIRPLVFGSAAREMDLSGVDPARAICVSGGALGHGRLEGIHDIVYVRPEAFDRALTRDVAGEVGTFNGRLRNEGRPYLLIGPGRWGSADHWLGIPVGWAQISGARCIVETEMADIQVTPSQGSHFFQNITAFGIGYFTIRRTDPRSRLDQAWLDAQPAQAESAHVRHLHFETPLDVIVDGRSGIGVVMRPGAR
jgi:DNA-binding NarL/FixJ family response regulator